MSLVYLRAALENAINLVDPILPSVVISSSTLGTTTVFTTSTPHGLISGLDITISNHTGSTPNLNGTYFVTVIDATHFSLVGKVTQTPVASTAGGTGGAVIANLTAYDNTGFKPVAGVPYQKVNLLPATPNNPSYSGPVTAGQRLRRELGILQVTLYYPVQKGTKAITTRAEAIRSVLPRGASFENNGLVVHISEDANIMIAGPIDESYAMVIRAPYWADVFY